MFKDIDGCLPVNALIIGQAKKCEFIADRYSFIIDSDYFIDRRKSIVLFYSKNRNRIYLFIKIVKKSFKLFFINFLKVFYSFLLIF